MNKPGMAAKNGLIEKKSRDFQPVSQGEMRYGLDVAAGALTFDLASAAQSERSRDRNGKKMWPGKPATFCETIICWTTLSERNDDAVAASARRCFTHSGESRHHALWARSFGVFAGVIETTAITGKPACCPQAD
jgi:hypothetical protein